MDVTALEFLCYSILTLRRASGRMSRPGRKLHWRTICPYSQVNYRVLVLFSTNLPSKDYTLEKYLLPSLSAFSYWYPHPPYSCLVSSVLNEYLVFINTAQYRSAPFVEYDGY